jgi:signal peptidase I
MGKFKLSTLSDLFLDLLEIAIIGVTVFVLVYIFIGQLLEVTGNSMEPTLHDQEQIIAEKISLKFKPLTRGEIVIFRHPENNERLLIKRVVGLPGERIKIENGFVYINGEVLKEPYLKEQGVNEGNKNLIEGVEYHITGNSYVLLGDNRRESSDSRSFGTIREELILGRSLMVYYPFNHIRLIEH